MTTAPPTTTTATAPASSTPAAEEADDGTCRPLTTEQLDIVIPASEWGWLVDFPVDALCNAFCDLVDALEAAQIERADIPADEMDATREAARRRTWLAAWRNRFYRALLLDAQVCREKGRRGLYVSAWERDLPGAPARTEEGGRP